MFTIDLHVHTRRFSPCAELLIPEELGAAAKAAGLNAVLLSEHDAMWSRQDVALLQKQAGPTRLLRGVELASKEAHFVIVGLEDLFGLRPGLPAAQLLPELDNSGAAIILAHPFRNTNIEGLLQDQEVIKRIHALEVYSSMTHGEDSIRAQQLALKNNWVAVAGSDAHSLDVVGRAYTQVMDEIGNEQQLAQSILQGRVVPRFQEARPG